MSEQEVFNALKYRVVVNEYARCYYDKDNQLHRTDGPAVIWADGTKCWYHNGLRHRTDGAAVEWACGAKEWYANGVRLSEAEFNQVMGLVVISANRAQQA